jgi:hypothetical protein
MPLQKIGTWCWHRLSEANLPKSEFVKQIKDIFRDGFGATIEWDETKIYRRLAEASILGLLEVPGGPPSGYAIYSSPEEGFDRKFMLWEDSICIRRSLQGRGASPKIEQLQNEVGYLLDRKFAWLGGDTQNPIVYKRYASLGRVFPIDSPYTSNLGQRLMRYLLTKVPQVKNRANALHIESGALRGIYREGRLGRYEEGISGTDDLEKYLRRHRICRENGDALLLVCELFDHKESSTISTKQGGERSLRG